jgi:hypothetical protein
VNALRINNKLGLKLTYAIFLTMDFHDTEAQCPVKKAFNWKSIARIKAEGSVQAVELQKVNFLSISPLLRGS